MEYKQLKKQIQQKQLSSCYVLYGAEQFVKLRTLDRLCQAALEGGDPGWNQNVLEEKATADEIYAACQTLPMFAPHRVVIVKESPLLKNGGGTAGEETLLSLIDSLPTETVLIFLLEGKPDGRRKLTVALKKKDALVEFSTMTEYEIFSWLKAYAAQRGKAVQPQALETLVQWVGTDMQTVATEMEKVCSYAARPWRPMRLPLWICCCKAKGNGPPGRWICCLKTAARYRCLWARWRIGCASCWRPGRAGKRGRACLLRQLRCRAPGLQRKKRQPRQRR